jgi:hypothetical protein
MRTLAPLRSTARPEPAPTGPSPTGTFRAGRVEKRRRLPVAWPLIALFVLYPLWWALGLPSFIFAILAVPMAFQLYRRGNVRVPPGFGLWLVLLAWVVLSGLMLDITAPNTLTPSGFGRYVGWGIRVMNYTALTVVMLYVLNLSERELPRLKMLRLFGFLAVSP